ncbi:hypothetical protein EDD22DRAFT_974190 [Suillus occidentalis]|nr:hypothetical protein EDD22DRAFT_974190 [Suillus occidentalis]
MPRGDILIHAGDLTHSGTPRELQDTFDWLTDEGHLWARLWQQRGIIYPEDEAHTIHVRGRAFKFFGSPFTPQHGNGAFQYSRTGVTGSPSRWSIIPNDTDILITHGPPHSHCHDQGQDQQRHSVYPGDNLRK